jgi:protein-tyrosine phosphatase
VGGQQLSKESFWKSGEAELNAARVVNWDGCFNVRDLGGLPLRGDGVTAMGVVIRADDLARLTTNGWRRFRTLGAGGVLDLRSRWEVEHWPSPLAELPIYENTPLWDDAMESAVKGLSLAEVYWAMTARLRPELALVIRRLAGRARQGPVVVHCFSGKDRTGLVSALLLDAAGVDRVAIGEDYAFSGTCLQAVFDGWLAAADPSERAELAQQLATEPDTILSVLGRLDEKFGGARPFLLACGVAPQDLEELCGRLVAQPV